MEEKSICLNKSFIQKNQNNKNPPSILYNFLITEKSTHDLPNSQIMHEKKKQRKSLLHTGKNQYVPLNSRIIYQFIMYVNINPSEFSSFSRFTTFNEARIQADVPDMVPVGQPGHKALQTQAIAAMRTCAVFSLEKMRFCEEK